MAERPNGFWHRSYLVNGRPKDVSIFQLDQQCYPILDLCDYLDCFPEEVDFTRNIIATGVIQEVLAVLESKHDAHTGLYATEETPGDDAVEYPFHFSSHVLLWRTFTRLHNLFGRLKLQRGDQVSQLDEMAAELKRRTLQSFTATHPVCDKRMFAYLTDGQGESIFYHDANDIPTLFAKEWSFVSSLDEVLVWKNTMEFSFSPANKGGYCRDGAYAGLGSVHSPGAWALGYFQELAFAASMEDTPAMQAAWTKISAAMNWDGTFSEAVDPNTAECTSKAWFSWPGAMIGALLIRMRMNGQEEVLLGESTG
jgi:meiotically up-regulated gene 157 (Mug157) protein